MQLQACAPQRHFLRQCHCHCQCHSSRPGGTPRFFDLAFRACWIPFGSAVHCACVGTLSWGCTYGMGLCHLVCKSTIRRGHYRRVCSCLLKLLLSELSDLIGWARLLVTHFLKCFSQLCWDSDFVSPAAASFHDLLPKLCSTIFFFFTLSLPPLISGGGGGVKLLDFGQKAGACESGLCVCQTLIKERRKKDLLLV